MQNPKAQRLWWEEFHTSFTKSTAFVSAPKTVSAISLKEGFIGKRWSIQTLLREDRIRPSLGLVLVFSTGAPADIIRETLALRSSMSLLQESPAIAPTCDLVNQKPECSMRWWLTLETSRNFCCCTLHCSLRCCTLHWSLWAWVAKPCADSSPSFPLSLDLSICDLLGFYSSRILIRTEGM